MAWRSHERAVHSESNGYRCNDCSVSCPTCSILLGWADGINSSGHARVGRYPQRRQPSGHRRVHPASTYRHPLSPSSPTHPLDELPVPFKPSTPPPHAASFSSEAGGAMEAGRPMPLDDSEVRTLAQVQYSAILYSTGLDALTYVKHGPDTDKASLGRVEIGQRLDAPPPGSKPAFDSGIQTARTYLAPHLVSPARRLIQDGTVELAQSPVTQIPQSPLGTRAAWEQWGLGPKPDFIPWPTVPPSASLVSYDTAGEYPANGACNPSGLAVSSAAPRIARSYKSRPNRARRAIDYQDDDGDVDQYRPSSSRPKQSPKSGNSYACPFRKHDRLKYNLQDRETCASHSWPDMCRLRYVVLVYWFITLGTYTYSHQRASRAMSLGDPLPEMPETLPAQKTPGLPRGFQKLSRGQGSVSAARHHGSPTTRAESAEEAPAIFRTPSDR